ncbi:hypothetical protein RHMOL_Rhmol01G0336500 [Rhododendron molle]|uniref:Uncharacterized protein n=1 Tax=Rhododendron molle TaxID=49168 RepID=A0ACC0Q862_RHOML|nr:hypothetical protein RHMOL_Rhmol01G0336500 [Rhododendron molle]
MCTNVVPHPSRRYPRRQNEGHVCHFPTPQSLLPTKVCSYSTQPKRNPWKLYQIRRTHTTVRQIPPESPNKSRICRLQVWTDRDYKFRSLIMDNAGGTGQYSNKL